MNSPEETGDVPVLTQVVEAPETAAGLDREQLAAQLENALIERLQPEIDRVVREAVAAAVAQALGEPKRG